MRNSRALEKVTGALLSLLCSSACTLVGPAALRGSRAAYNDAIVETNNQQVLAMIVRMRYGEPAGLLAVSSITANMRVQASSNAEFGVGADSNYRGNLVPLSAGVAYEENPTISYTPVQGETYMREFLSPLPLDLTVLLLRALGDSPEVMNFLLRGINGVRNPRFAPAGSPGADERFARLAHLVSELSSSGQVSWTLERGPSPSCALVLADADGAGAGELAELRELLGLAALQPTDDRASWPVRSGSGAPQEPAVHLDTRSLYELFDIMASSLDVPAEHIERGIAQPAPFPPPVGDGLRIRSSEDYPEQALVAVRHHDRWYFVDGADPQSKRMFRIVEALVSVRIADAADHDRASPVITVPVSR